jgi:hypothetical protein
MLLPALCFRMASPCAASALLLRGAVTITKAATMGQSSLRSSIVMADCQIQRNSCEAFRSDTFCALEFSR